MTESYWGGESREVRKWPKVKEGGQLKGDGEGGWPMQLAKCDAIFMDFIWPSSNEINSSPPFLKVLWGPQVFRLVSGTTILAHSMHFETFLKLLEKEMWPKKPKNDQILFLKLKKSHWMWSCRVAQIRVETKKFHVVYSKPATWGVQRDYFSFKHKFWSFWGHFGPHFLL